MSRNPFIPKIVLAMPVMVMLVMPLVADLDVKNVNVAVVDYDRGQLSRRIIADMAAAGLLDVAAFPADFNEGMLDVENGGIDVLLVIPPGFEKNLPTGAAKLDFRANGVNATKGMLGAQYAGASALSTIRRWSAVDETEAQADDAAGIVNLYNPTLDFRNYMIPALMVVLLIIICGFLPTLNLVSEKESGTIETMNVTPVDRFTFVLSKLLPFWVVGLVVVSVGMFVGWVVYGLAPVGGIWLIYLAAILFSLVMSGLGVTIANCSSTMLQAVFVMFACIMVFQLMGGLFTPVDSMPEWARSLTYAVPPRYFNEIMRAVYLKGAEGAYLLPRFFALIGFSVIFIIAAAISYRKKS